MLLMPFAAGAVGICLLLGLALGTIPNSVREQVLNTWKAY